MKLGLGTVQFGLDYGLTNKQGRPSLNEIQKILDCAYTEGIDLLDTAAAYGESESVLGELAATTRKFKVVTKIPVLGKEASGSRVSEEIEKSLQRLKRSSVDAILFHSAQDLLTENAEERVAAVLRAQKAGLVKKWGVSVYNETEAQEIRKRFAYEVVQLPINMLDQAWIRSGYLSELKTAGVEIHARSLFLQGVLLSNPENLPVTVSTLKAHLQKLSVEAKSRSTSTLALALAFAKSVTELDYAILGVTQVQELKEISAAFAEDIRNIDWSQWAWQGASEVLDPRKWSAK